MSPELREDIAFVSGYFAASVKEFKKLALDDAENALPNEKWNSLHDARQTYVGLIDPNSDPRNELPGALRSLLFLLDRCRKDCKLMPDASDVRELGERREIIDPNNDHTETPPGTQAVPLNTAILLDENGIPILEDLPVPPSSDSGSDSDDVE